MAEGGISSDIDFQDVGRPPDRDVPTRGVLPEKNKIQTHFLNLVDELACRPDAIIDSLYSKNVIDNDDVQKITKEAKNGSRAMAKKILWTLLGCGPGAYNKFISCLHDNNFAQALLLLEPTDFARGPADQCVEAAIDALQNHNVKNLSGVHIVSDDIELLKDLRQDLKCLRYSTDCDCEEERVNEECVALCSYIKRKAQEWLDMPGIKGTLNEKLGMEFFNTGTKKNGEAEDELTTSSEDADGALYKQNLPNGMVITLYDDDIVNIPSDILVCYKYNTAKYRGRIDKHLKQVGGRDYIQSLKSLEEEGDLESWKVYFTLAGNLQFHLVYQAVIPELDEENTEEWLSNLQILYSTILTTADEEKRDSVTFPIIGIGPVDQCIEAFITTLKHHDVKTTQNIKIVANNEAKINKFCRGLTEAIGTAPTALKQRTASMSEDPLGYFASMVGSIVNPDVLKGLINETCEMPLFKTGDRSPNGKDRNKSAVKENIKDGSVTKRKNTLKSYNRKIPNGLVVFVYNEDVVDVHADILVVCNDKKGSSKRGLAKYLKAKGGRHYTDSLETLMEMEGELKDWNLYFTFPGNLKFKEIYQVIIPQMTDGGDTVAPVAVPAVENDASDDDDDDCDDDDDDDAGAGGAAPVATGEGSSDDDAGGDPSVSDGDAAGGDSSVSDGDSSVSDGDAAGAAPVAAGAGGSDDDARGECGVIDDDAAGGGYGGGDRLQRLYSQILSTADRDKQNSITIPLLGSGVSGGQTVQCIEAAIGAIQTHPVTNLRQINIVTKDDGVYDLLRDKLKTLPTDNGG